MPFLDHPDYPLRSREREPGDRWFVFPPGGAFCGKNVLLTNLFYISECGFEFDSSAARQKLNFIEHTKARQQSEFGNYMFSNFPLPFTSEFLVDGISQYGIFAEHNLLNKMDSLVYAMMHTSDYNPIEYLSVLKGVAPGFIDFTEEDIPRSIMLLVHFYLDNLVLDLMNEQRAVSALDGWYERYGGLRPCELCGHMFNRSWLIPGYYKGTLYRHVCLSCPMMEYPIGESALRAIREFVDFLGFIPSSSMQMGLVGYEEALLPERYAESCRLWMRMGGIEHVKREFGSWFHGLALSGALPSGVQATTRGIKCLASDGHVCRSLAEQKIDNWLTAHGFAHTCEPYYPFHPTLNPNGQGGRGGLRADWLVGETYIEYFGLASESDYLRKMWVKRQIAQQTGMHLIELLPTDTGRLEEALGILLRGGAN